MEVIAVGFNRYKEYGAIGIGRHGNFLQWGYWDPPSRMTEGGRRLFINCIHYIHRFDGKPPLVRRQWTSDRLGAMPAAGSIKSDRTSGDRKQAFLLAFPEELYAKYGSDPKGLRKYYEENVEWIYVDTVYRVDEELKALGLASNRKVETLECLFELRKDPARREIAQRLLDRYTDGHTTFDFQNGRDRIYFTDIGGYKFLVVPEGYLFAPSRPAASPSASP